MVKLKDKSEFWLRKEANLFSDNPEIRFPRIKISPESGWLSVPRICSSVVLPAPLAPTMEYNHAFGNFKVNSFEYLKRSEGFMYIFRFYHTCRL
jgi:hypothetical protein